MLFYFFPSILASSHGASFLSVCHQRLAIRATANTLKVFTATRAANTTATATATATSAAAAKTADEISPRARNRSRRPNSRPTTKQSSTRISCLPASPRVAKESPAVTKPSPPFKRRALKLTRGARKAAPNRLLERSSQPQPAPRKSFTTPWTTPTPWRR